MFVLLIAMAAAAAIAAAALILLVAWAVRQEEARLTMVDQPPGRLTHAVRRVLDLRTIGVASPGQDQHTVRCGRPPSGYPGQIDDDLGGPGTAGWLDPQDLPAGWPGPRGPGPDLRDSTVGV